MKNFIFLILSLFLSIQLGLAQTTDNLKTGSLIDGKTIVKANLAGLAIRNYGFSAERIINKTISLSFYYNNMPMGVPYFHKQLVGVLYTDDEGIVSIKRMKLGSYSFTPEIRFYTGKGYGQGFYVSPYFRYQKYNVTYVDMPLMISGKKEFVDLYGAMDTYCGGIMIGYQKFFGKKKNFLVDVSVLGLHFGTNKINIEGHYSGTFDDNVKNDIKKIIENSAENISFIVQSQTNTVTNNSLEVNSNGLWGFLRAGVSFGFRF